MPRSFPASGFRLALLLASSAVVFLPAAEAQEAPTTVELDQVVITASGFSQQIVDAPASITVIDGKQLEARPYANITDVLKDTPGLSIEGGGKLNAPSITIRGMSEAYVLLLVDGKPLGATEEAFYNGYGQGQKTAMLPPASAIERIEVIRGPMSSLYGSAASGGVINVITKKVSDVWTGSYTLEGMAPGGKGGASAQGRFYAAGPLVADRLGLAVYGSAYDRRADEIEDGTPETQRRTLGARLTWAMTDMQEAGVEVSRVAQDYRNTVDTTGVDNAVSSTTTHAALTHVLRWGNGAETRSFLTHEDVDIENGDLRSSYRMTNLNSRTVLPLGTHNLTFGVDARRERTVHDPSRFPGSTTTDLTRWHAAAFAEDEWTINHRLSVTMGARLDRNEHYGTNVTPRLYAVWHLNDQFTLKGGVSGGYKVPSLKQADDNIVEPAGGGRGWDGGNSDLKPEESTNYEVGLVWSGPNALEASLTAYHTAFRNKIDRTYLCETPQDAPPGCRYGGETREWIRQYVNVDGADIDGVEATLDATLGQVDLRANYTHQRSRITSGPDQGKPLNNLPEHLLNLRFDYDATDRLNLWGSARYRSEVKDDDDRIPSYTLVDLGLSYQMNDSLQAFAGVNNVFDKQITSENYGKVLDGRTVFLGLTSNF